MATTHHEARREALAASLRAELGRKKIDKPGLVRLMAGKLSKATVYRYWNGERDISVPDLEAICDAARVDIMTVLRVALNRD